MSRKSITITDNVFEPPFTIEEDNYIVRQRNEKGRLWVSIAAALENRNAEDIKKRYEEVMHKILYGKIIVKPKKVRCLGHGATHYFISPDPRRVRLCAVCKDSNKHIAEGYALAEFGYSEETENDLFNNGSEETDPLPVDLEIKGNVVIADTWYEE